MIEPLRVEFLRDWDRQVEPHKQEAYVESELKRLRAGRVPLLYAILMLPLPEQIDVAIKVLQRTGYATAFLRLHPEAEPWSNGPDGLPLSAPELGNAHICKVGVVGQSADGRPVDGTQWHTTGPGRISAERDFRPLLRTTTIRRDPQAVPIADAIVIMRQWGIGVTSRGRERVSDAGQRRSRWLIEEVPQGANGMPDTDASGSGKGAPMRAPEPPARPPSQPLLKTPPGKG